MSPTAVPHGKGWRIVEGTTVLMTAKSFLTLLVKWEKEHATTDLMLPECVADATALMEWRISHEDEARRIAEATRTVSAQLIEHGFSQTEASLLVGLSHARVGQIRAGS